MPASVFSTICFLFRDAGAVDICQVGIFISLLEEWVMAETLGNNIAFEFSVSCPTLLSHLY